MGRGPTALRDAFGGRLPDSTAASTDGRYVADRRDGCGRGPDDDIAGVHTDEVDERRVEG